LAVIAV